MIVASASCHGDDWLQYRWDDRQILCSQTMDDKTGDASIDDIVDQLARARDDRAVTFVHGHDPGRTFSFEQLDNILARADAYGLEYVTFPELVPGEPRAALALAFDDTYIAAWHALRPRFTEHAARVTFFVTRLHSRTDEELAMLADLAADGHAIEAHGVEHLDAQQYVCDHSPEAYMTNEVLPSIDGIRALGYAGESYAYPFGNDDPDVNDMLLEHVHRIRVSPGACRY